MHDGLLDITNASNLVTVSWNRFENHDKVMLIGSADSMITDRGKLRVTLHHKLFEDLGQRTPRVRFGQVHVYNNYYRIKKVPNYGYSWGVGIESAIHASGTLVDGTSDEHLVDVVAAWNAVNDLDLLTDAGWAPTLFTEIQPALEVRSAVQDSAGPFAW